MVTDLLLDVAFAIVSFAWNLVPDWTIEVQDFQPLVSEMSRYNAFAPFSELLAISGIMVAFFAVMHGTKIIIKLVDWVMDIIP